MYKNQYHSLCLFEIVFQVFQQVIKVWKTVNKFHLNLLCLLINAFSTHYIFWVNKGNLLLKLKHGRNSVFKLGSAIASEFFASRKSYCRMCQEPG